MNDISVFIGGVGIAMAISAGAVVYLRANLRKLLVDICGTEDRANFWTSFTNITLVLVPLIFAIQFRPRPDDSGSPIFQLGSEVEWALIGLVSSVVFMGIVISQFIPRANRT